MKLVTVVSVLLFVFGLSTTPCIAGTEPSPFGPQAKLLLPAIKNFKSEVANAKVQVGKFDAKKGQDLGALNFTNTSVPAMINYQKSVAGVIGDIGKPGSGLSEKGIIIVGTLDAKNKSLKALLDGQKNNTKDPKLAMDALNKMEKILGEMSDDTAGALKKLKGKIKEFDKAFEDRKNVLLEVI